MASNISNLVYYYRFETSDLSGNTLDNLAPNSAYDLSLSSVSLINTNNYFVGQSALNLNNTTATRQWANWPNGITLPSSSSGFSISFWISALNLSSTTASLFDFSNSLNAIDDSGKNAFYAVLSGNQLIVNLVSSGSNIGQLVCPIVETDGIWRHVLITYSSTNMVSIYVNGALCVSSTFSGYPSTSYSYAYLGNDTTQSSNFLTGALDEFRIYNIVLSDVNDIYYLAYYPTYQPYITSSSVTGNTFSSNFYDSNQTSFTQYFTPRTVFPGTVLLFSGKPGQNVKAFDGTANSYTYVSPIDIVLDTYSTAMYVCDSSTGKLVQTDLITGKVSTLYTLPNISSVVVDPSNTTYFITDSTGNIRSVDLSSNTLNGNVLNGSYTNVICLLLSPDKTRLYFSHSAGISYVSLPISSYPATPTLLYADASGIGDIVFPQTDTVGSTIYAMSISSQIVYGVSTASLNTAYSITMPTGALISGTKLSDCAFDTQGNMYISTHSGSCGIWMVPFYVVNAISSNTTLTSDQLKPFAGGGTFGYSGDGGQCLTAQFGKIDCVICDSMDNLYFTDSMYSVIRKITGSGGKGTKFLNNIINEAGTDGYHDISKIYSQSYSVGSAPQQVPLSYGTDGSLANRIEGRFQTATHSIIDNSGLLIYYRFNPTDVSGAYIANYATGMPIYDASLNYDLSNNISPYISSNDFACENSALNISSTSLGTWQSISNSLPTPNSTGLPAIPSIITPNRSYTTTPYYGSKFGHWNSVSASASGSYVSAVGDYDVFYQANSGQAAGAQLKWTPMYSPPITTTVYGTGGSTYTGDLGYALSAAAGSLPKGFRIINGDYYIAEYNNNRVRVIYSSSGIVNTICGTGTSSSTGDGGLATSATTQGPSDIIMDASNNIYISELYKVRVIYGNGIISTFAGTGTATSTGDRGLATAATFNVINNIEFDSSYNMYVVEQNGGRVRIIYKGNNIVGTVAGGGASTGDGGQATAAVLNLPRFIALDNSRNIYISENGANKIRLVTNSTGIISTVVGSGLNKNSGIPGLSANIVGVNGLTFDSSKNNLYFSQETLGKISYYNVASGLVYNVLNNGNIAGTHSMDANPFISRGNGTYALRMDSSDNLYFVDTLNYKLRRISTITPFPGFTQSPFPIACMLACGGLSWEFIKINGTGQYQIAYAKCYGAFLSSSYGANTSWNYVLDLSGIYIKSAAMSFTGQYISATDPYGNVYVSSGYGANGTWSRTYTNTQNIYNTAGPTSIAMSATGQYQVATTYNTETILPFLGTGASGYAAEGAPWAVTLNGSTSLAFDSSNNMLFADRFNHRFRKYTLNTNATTLLMGTGAPSFPATSGTASGATLNFPKGVVCDVSNNFYINMYYALLVITGLTYRVIAGSATSGALGDTAVASATTSFNTNQYVIVNQLGDFLITDYANNKVRAISSGNNFVSTVVGTGTASNTGDGGLANLATIQQPISIAYDSFNNMYVAGGGNTVRKVDALTGIITRIVGTGTASSTGDGGQAQNATVNTPYVYVDPYNNLYVPELTSNCIRKVNPINNQIYPSSTIITYVGNARTASSTGNYGLPADATINAPEHGMFHDNYGAGYVMDNLSYRIRKTVQCSNIIVSTDYGNTWTNKTTALTGNIWFNNVAINSTGQYMSATTIYGNSYICTGNIYTSSDFGNTWTLNTSIPTKPWGCIAISATGQYQFAAGYDMSGGYYSTDYGQTWSLGNLPWGNWCQLAWVESQNTMYAVSKNIGNFTSVFYNTNFNLVAAGARKSQHVASGNTILSSASWPTVNGLTFATWIKSNSNADFAKIFDFGTGATPLSNNIVMGVYGNTLYYGVYNGTTPGNTFTQIGLNDNSWKHIAITMTYAPSGSNTSMHSVYVNGTIATRNYNTGNTRYPNQVARPACYIGKGALITDPSFNGIIDDFRVYNRVLNDREIYKLYAPSEAVHLYRFDNEDYDQTGVFLANYAPKNVVWDALHTCKFTPPPLITTNTTINITAGSTIFNGITGNLVGFYTNQSVDTALLIYNNSTSQYTYYDPVGKIWKPLVNSGVASGLYTGFKFTLSGATGVACTINNGIYYITRGDASTGTYYYRSFVFDSVSRAYNSVNITGDGSKIVAIADYIYFTLWSDVSWNYGPLISTNIYTGLNSGTHRDIAMTADGSRIVYADINNNLYFASWNNSLTTYTNSTLITSLPYSIYTSITMSYDGQLLIYAYNISGMISIYYAIWNGSTYSNITFLFDSSTITRFATLYSSVQIELTYDMSTLFISMNRYNGSVYTGVVLPIYLSFLNTYAKYMKYGTNCLIMRENSLMTTKKNFIKLWPSVYTVTPWATPPAGLVCLSVSDDYTLAMMASSTTGLIYYSLYSPQTYSWSAFTQTLQSTLTGIVDGKTTGDGLRGVVITSSAVYFYTWNGINYSTCTRTLDTTPLTFLRCDMTYDGSRLFVVTTSYIYYADWNGTNYGQWISTGITYAGGPGSYSAIGCSRDGLKIAYSFFDNAGVSATYGYMNWAYWNGSTYTVYQNTLYSHSNTVGNIRTIRFSYDSIFIVFSWINNAVLPWVFAWNGSTYINTSQTISIGSANDRAGLWFSSNFSRFICATGSSTSTSIFLQKPSFISYFTPSTTITPNFYTTSTSGFTGLSVSADNTKMVFGNYSTNYIYYLSKRPEVNTWNFSTITKTLQTPLPSTQIVPLKLTPDGKRGVYGLNSSGAHFVFNWIPEQNNYSSGIPLLGGTSAGALGLDITYDGSRLLVQRGATIHYASWIGWNYGTWYNTGFTSNAMGVDAAGYKMAYLDSTYMYFALWNGYSYIQIDASTASNASYRKLWLNYDGTYGFYTSNGQTAKFFAWDGIKYTDVVSIPTTNIPSGDMWPFDITGDRKTIYFGNQSTTWFGQTSMNLQTPPIVANFTIPSPYSIITSFSAANTLTPSIGQCGGIATNQAGTRMVITDKTTGLMYVSTYFGGAWSAFQQTLQTTQLGSGYALQMRLTADGSRGVMSVGITNTMYFFTWTGSNYSTYQTTAVTGASAFTGIDLTADGRRAFLVNTTAIYWSDWNGLTYNPVQTTGIAGAATNSYVACNTDGSRIVYNINTTNWTYAVWNGITYVPQNTFSSMLTAGSIRSVIWSYDNQYVFWTIYLNASASLAYAVWNQDLNNFTNSGYVSTSAVPANLSNSAMAIDNTGVYEVTLTTPTIYRMPINYTTIPTYVQGYSFSYWFKNQGSQDYAGLISFQGVNGWIMMFLIGNALYATVNEQAFSLPTNVLPTSMLNHVQVATVAQNTWYHVCWTIQQINTSYNTVGSALWTVYLNGQQVYQSSAQRYPYPGKRSLNFLAFNGLNNVYLNGSVDDYRTYQTILTADEVLNIYNTTNVFNTPSLTNSPSIDITNAVGIYSTKIVNNLYTGPIFNIRRDSDNLTADFYGKITGYDFYLNNTSNTSIVSWLNGANAYVTIWYDQSGRNNHATQTVLGSQPIFYIYNNYVDLSGSLFMNLPNGTVPYNNTPYTVMFCGNTQIITTNGYLGSGNNGTTNLSNSFNITTTTKPTGYTAGYTNYWYNNDSAQNIGIGYQPFNVVTTTYDGSSEKLYVKRVSDISGSLQQTFTNTGRSSTSQNNTIGVDNASRYWNGQIYSLFIFNATLSQSIQQSYELSATAYDSYSDPNIIMFAVSMRVIVPSYTGPVVKVRRSSDNETSDFYTDSTQSYLSTGPNNTGLSYATWIGANTGYATIWYNQNNTGNHAINNANDTTQPIVAVQNSKYVLQFASGKNLCIIGYCASNSLFCHFYNTNTTYGTILGCTGGSDYGVRFDGTNARSINGGSSPNDWYYSGTGTKYSYANGVSTGSLSGTSVWQVLSLIVESPVWRNSATANIDNAFFKVGSEVTPSRGINGYMVEMIGYNRMISRRGALSYYSNRLF